MKQNDRGPEDYPEGIELEIPVRRYHPQVAVSGGRERTAQRIAENVLQGLLVAGITALIAVTWKLSDTVTRIDTYLSERAKQYEREFDRINGTLERHDKRINSLEQQRRHP